MNLATDAIAVDPWQQTLSLLLQLCRSNEARSFACSSEPLRARWTEPRSHLRTTGAGRRTVSVSFVDRVSATEVTIAWRDSTHCSYGDQAWHATRARTSGACALSGRPVRIGDAVYQPRGRPRPLNAGAMILASALHEAEENR
ncbi:hypothetical protein WT27_29575 [Burkholderia territorii]|uniref:DUF3331 domain-containing protein n=1 Tax=Burkholderia territorii TaxID=1503055 RepID=A0A106ECJ4_9BURK|nr:DUF3331 domain-containing protein [Burkholderia territorii]KVV51822.1 hypothetical protein WT27_29575 [Burkholderia territorii]KVX44967.1 hypothetical protein WT31_24715 [Burkholderia territorii]